MTRQAHTIFKRNHQAYLYLQDHSLLKEFARFCSTSSMIFEIPLKEKKASHHLSYNKTHCNQPSGQSVFHLSPFSAFVPFPCFLFYGPLPLFLNSPIVLLFSFFLFHFIYIWMQPLSISPPFFFLPPQPFLLHPSLVRSLTQLSHSWSIPVGLAFSILRLCKGHGPPTVMVAGSNRRQRKECVRV